MRQNPKPWNQPTNQQINDPLEYKKFIQAFGGESFRDGI